MAVINENTRVEVGHTEIGEVYVGEVDLGSLTREVELDITPEDYWDACSEDERLELIVMSLESGAGVKEALPDMNEADFQELFNNVLSVGEEYFSIKPPTPVSQEEADADTREQTSNQFDVTPAMPSVELIRMVKRLDELTEQEIAAFPRNVIQKIQEKFVGAMDPIKICEIPEELNDILKTMGPGEITPDFVQSLQTFTR